MVKSGEEVNEEEPVDKDETQPKEEEAELPPLISTDDTDDLLVCFWLGGNGMNVSIYLSIIISLVLVCMLKPF